MDPVLMIPIVLLYFIPIIPMVGTGLTKLEQYDDTGGARWILAGIFWPVALVWGVLWIIFKILQGFVWLIRAAIGWEAE